MMSNEARKKRRPQRMPIMSRATGSPARAWVQKPRRPRRKTNSRRSRRLSARPRHEPPGVPAKITCEISPSTDLVAVGYWYSAPTTASNCTSGGTW